MNRNTAAVAEPLVEAKGLTRTFGSRKVVGPADVVRIGTRGSELARRQAAPVEAFLQARGREVEIVIVRTAADKKQKEPITPSRVEGFFTRELEAALAKGKVDCCVHSLKDLPVESAEGLDVAAVLERADPRDALLLNPVANAGGLDDLSSGSRVGTSSPGTRAQLLAARPDLDVVELRGSLPARLRKLDEGRLHGAVLGAAGLIRLGAQQRITAYLEPPGWLPAAGQGAIAVQIRASDDGMRALVDGMNHQPTSTAVRAERAFVAGLGGGVGAPMGALVVADDSGAQTLHGFVSDLSGRNVIRGSARFDAAAPETCGELLAREIRDRGGASLMAELRGG